MSKGDIKNRKDIHFLVSAFYDNIKKDNLLAPFFNETVANWDEHIEHLTNFWESSLFLQTRFYGDPLKKHIGVDEKFNHSISEHHFSAWINLWIQTINEYFEGDYAENAKNRARKMSTFIHLKIFEARQNLANHKTN